MNAPQPPPLPPPPAGYRDSSPPPPLPPPKPNSQRGSGSGTATPNQQEAPLPGSPLRSEAIFAPSLLSDLSRDDLLLLLSNSDLLDALYKSTHPASAPTSTALNHAIQTNLSHAQRLEAFAHSLEGARDSTSTSLLQTRSLERSWRDKEKEMYVALSKFSAPALHARLGQAVSEADAISKALEESFLEDESSYGDDRGAVKGGKDVENFVKSYRSARVAYHLRKERKERWDENRVGGWR